ncbi:MAG: AIR synthase, partial [Streptomyces sp.]|nr:AIR synthase [Streptomyces sp.]
MSAVNLDGSLALPAVDDPQDILALLGDRSTLARRPAFRIEEAHGTADLAAYRELRRAAFVQEQGLFAHHDLDDHDTDPRTVVLIAKDPAGTVVGGV